MQREIAESLLNLKAVKLSTDPPFTWVSGIRSPIYCDNRVLMSFPQDRKMIIKYLLEMIRNDHLEPEVICGTASSGIPWACWIAAELDLPMVYARKKAKEYGVMKQLEGVLEPGKNVLVVEDLISTGSSSVNAAETVRQAGGVVTDILALFSYELEKADRILQGANVKLHALSNFSTLIEVAIQKGYLRPEEQAKVLEWSDDPEGWWYTYYME